MTRSLRCATMQSRRLPARSRRPLTSIRRNRIMVCRNDITQEFLRQLLHYDPSSGMLTWKARSPAMFVADARWSSEAKSRQWNAKYANGPAGGLDGKGYVRIRIGGFRFRAHRLIWRMMKGTWPRSEVDHRDGDRQNNRLDNLREATSAQNSQNRRKRITNTSGFTGVYWHKKTSQWRVELAVDGQRIYGGLFHRKDDAASAYLILKKRHHKFQPTPRGGV